MKHPSGAAEDKRQENPPEYYHRVCGDSDGLCRKRFLTIGSPQQSFAKQMQGEPIKMLFHNFLFQYYHKLFAFHLFEVLIIELQKDFSIKSRN